MREVPMKWSDGHLIGDENALLANLGNPSLDPPNLAPDSTIPNFNFGIIFRAIPSTCIPSNAANKTAPCKYIYNLKKVMLHKIFNFLFISIEHI